MVEVWYQLPVSAEIDYIMSCALKAEEIGFDGVSNEDHFWVTGIGGGCRPECWTMLTAIAAKTNLKVSSLVTCMPYRNPVILAKAVATLDHLSKGRVMLIYGAGWWREEFEAFGYKWEPDGIRVERTFEAVSLIKKLWTEDKVTFNGKYYSVRNCWLDPKPYQKPHPPLICGGNGRRMRIFAAKNADGWVSPLKIVDGEIEEYIARRRTVEKYVGDRPFLYGICTRFKPDEVKMDDIIDSFKEYVKLGVTWINVRIDPDNENLRLLDKIKVLIDELKEK